MKCQNKCTQHANETDDGKYLWQRKGWEKKSADRFPTFVFWSYFLCFLQIDLNTTSTKNISQTGISLLQDTLNTKTNTPGFNLLNSSIACNRLSCADVTMALLYSFNPCQAWALRKSALVFAWLSSRACQTQQKDSSEMELCFVEVVDNFLRVHSISPWQNSFVIFGANNQGDWYWNGLTLTDKNEKPLHVRV